MSFRGASNVAGLFADTPPSERMTRSLLAVPGRSFNGPPNSWAAARFAVSTQRSSPVTTTASARAVTPSAATRGGSDARYPRCPGGAEPAGLGSPPPLTLHDDAATCPLDAPQSRDRVATPSGGNVVALERGDVLLNVVVEQVERPRLIPTTSRSSRSW